MSAAAAERLEDGWLRLRVPLPYSLKWVNAYLLPGEDGWTVVDPGLGTDEARGLWTRALKEEGIGWDRITRIVLTHHHPDHYGLAGWMQERTGAPVWMSEAARTAAERMWGNGETYSAELLEAFREHGLPRELTGEMRIHLTGFRERVSPQPRDPALLTAGSSVRMAEREWELIGGEGHAPGHLSFYDRAARRLLCGDQVIPDISPNIGWMPGGDPNPLGSYLESLSSLLRLDVDQAFPGHRDPFTGFRKRVLAILDHHERRLVQISEWFDSGESRPAFDICEALFGTRLRGNLHNLRFALAETVAHLILLERRGVLARRGRESASVTYTKR